VFSVRFVFDRVSVLFVVLVIGARAAELLPVAFLCTG
jgi:hypothetical protein